MPGLSQINHVGNPSFEEYYNCNLPAYISTLKYWNSIDSVKLSYGGKHFNICHGTVPFNANTYQNPRTGNGYIMATQYCVTPCTAPLIRQYPKNRLKYPLNTNSVYCVKMYVNINNSSPYGNDAFGIHLGDASIDTITQCGLPLTYLIPQIKNPTSNIITDTLNWIEVSGTYTATGNEKYLVLGNFIPNSSVNQTFLNSGYSGVWTDVVYDDVSVIDFNLAAYAGPDKNITLGDSAFIGRPPEIGLECSWATGTTTIGTGGGIWVKPTATGTYSYVVTQTICGNVKTDTVNVNISSGIHENMAFAQSIGIYPQPAKEAVTISLNYFYEPSVEVRLVDVTGKVVGSSELVVRNGKTQLETKDLSNGVYILQIKNASGQFANKKLIVTK